MGKKQKKNEEKLKMKETNDQTQIYKMRKRKKINNTIKTRKKAH